MWTSFFRADRFLMMKNMIKPLTEKEFNKVFLDARDEVVARLYGGDESKVTDEIRSYSGFLHMLVRQELKDRGIIKE